MTAPNLPFSGEPVPTIGPSVNADGSPNLGTATANGTYSARSPLFDNYATKSDGVPVKADSGQTWYQYPASGASAMQVVSGRLTNTVASGLSAGYQQYDFGVGSPVGRIGVKGLTFTPYSTTAGAFTIGTWKTLDTGTGVPDSNCHLAISPTLWILGTWAGGVFTQRAQGTFAVPLTADGVTPYSVDVVLTGTTIYILLPDGSVATVTNAAFAATPGTIAFFETYASAASTDTKAGVAGVFAEPVALAGDGPVSQQRALPLIAPLVPFGGIPKTQAKQYAPAVEVDVALTGSQTVIDTTNLRMAVLVPPSGSFIVDLSGYVAIGAVTDFYWGIQVGGTGLNTALVAKAAPVGGPQRYTARFLITGQTPGVTLQLDWNHFAITTNAATQFQSSGPNGKLSVMTAIPL